MAPDLGVHSPLIDLFLRGEVSLEIRRLAAAGQLTPDHTERMALIALMHDDPEPTVVLTARETAAALEPDEVARWLARADAPSGLRRWLEARAVVSASESSAAAGYPASNQTEAAAEGATEADQAEIPTARAAPAMTAAPATTSETGGTSGTTETSETSEATDDASPQLLSSLSVPARIKLAMLGTREQRAVLVRDPNRVVSSAVLSSPKLSDIEVETFARMSNVSADVLRVIGTNRAWLKSYGVVAALVRNPRTPPAISLGLVSRLQERDVKTLATDRNVQEVLRIAARKLQQAQHARRS